jgi:hypothetical protein
MPSLLVEMRTCLEATIKLPHINFIRPSITSPTTPNCSSVSDYSKLIIGMNPSISKSTVSEDPSLQNKSSPRTRFAAIPPKPIGELK